MANIDNIEYHITTVAETVYVTIPGSGRFLSPFQHNDWFRTNFFVLPIDGVHAGYLIAAMKLMRAERTAWHAEKIVIKGHSLGGAVAVVLAALLQKQYKNKDIKAHNYGGPAPFSRLWRRWHPHSLHRHRAGNDIVPYVIPWNRHCAKIHKLPSISWNPIINHIKGYSRWMR